MRVRLPPSALMEKILRDKQPHPFDVLGKRNWRLIGNKFFRVFDPRENRVISLDAVRIGKNTDIVRDKKDIIKNKT